MAIGHEIHYAVIVEIVLDYLELTLTETVKLFLGNDIKALTENQKAQLKEPRDDQNVNIMIRR